LPLADEVAPAEFFGSQAHRSRDTVHVPLQSKNALRRAEPAEGAVRRMIGGHGAAAHADVGTKVRTRRVDRARESTTGDSVLLGSAVNGEVDLHAQEFSVF